MTKTCYGAADIKANTVGFGNVAISLPKAPGAPFVVTGREYGRSEHASMDAAELAIDRWSASLRYRLAWLWHRLRHPTH